MSSRDMAAELRQEVECLTRWAERADRMAQESVDGGWSTHQVGALRTHADEFRRRAEGIRETLRTSAEGMPDFGPGDMVRYNAHYRSPDVHEVEGVYVDSEGEWCAVLTSGKYDHAAAFERVPREVTKLVRVTGPEDGVAEAERTLMQLKGRTAIVFPEGVRVEIVEDER